MKILLPIFVFLPILLGLAQGPQNNYYIDFNTIDLPESPLAASLGLYGDVPVNTATGVPNIEIPLYTLEVDGVRVPISLSYHASGIKVNDIPTAVGLKWTLLAGGGFFRTVKSRPDEEGWLTTDKGPFPDSWYEGFDPDDFDYQSSFQHLMMGNLDHGPFRGKASEHDHMPDEYSYSFPGWSGEFITTRTGGPLKNRDDGLKIHFNDSPERAQDQMGNSFYFGGRKETSNRRYTYGSTGTGGGLGAFDGYDMDPDLVTGWMLDSIATKNGRTILFRYEPYTITEYAVHPIANHITYAMGCGAPPYASHSTTNVSNDYTVQLIKEISSPNVRIDFTYATDESLSLWKRKLAKITVNDLLSGDRREFRLEYGKYGGDARLRLEKVFEVGYRNNAPEPKPPYVFGYEGSPLPALYSFSQDFFGYYNAKANPSLAPKSNWAEGLFQGAQGIPTTFYHNHTGDRSLNTSTVGVGILTSIGYPTGGVTSFTYEPNAEQVSGSTKYCGGLRVSKIEKRDFPNAPEPVGTTTYSYEGLFGDDLESNVYKTVKSNVDRYGANISYAFHSSFVGHPLEVFGGYFYKKVTTRATGNGKVHKREEYYRESPSYGKYNSVLVSELVYNGSALARATDYGYAPVGTGEWTEWNILGTMVCLRKPQIGGDTSFLGYNVPPAAVSAGGNWTELPVSIATTDYLKKGTANAPVTMVRFLEYDDATLLKTREVTSARYVRGSNGALSVSDASAEEITVRYTYPWSPWIGLGLPPALPIGKRVFSSKAGADEIFGQFFEYDTHGNVKRAFQYARGEPTSTPAPAYVPQGYPLTASFLYQNGNPVQVVPTGGAATSYIWGLNGQYPVAKVEGKPRAAIPSARIAAVEGSSYSGLPNALGALRADPSMEGALLTTYTYRPLSGVETVTDPKGDMTAYQYDGLGRLEYVRDRDGNLLSENKYNYGN